MTLGRPIVFVVYAEVTAPVVRSQTMPLLHALREAGEQVDAAALTSARRLVIPTAWATHHEALGALEAAAGRKPIRLTHAPRDRGIERSGRALARELRRRGEENGVALCRQPRAAMVGIEARRALARRGGDLKVVLDLRGIRDVEYLLTLDREEDRLLPDEKARLETYRLQEAVACTESDAVLCVSRPMMQLIGERYGVNPAKVGRIPNHARPVEYAEDLRGAARGEFDVSGGAILVAYSGTLAAWQMAEESTLLVAALQRMRPTTHMLFLTPDERGARDVIKRTGLERAIVRSAPQEEVSRLLAAADYGLLLRRDSPVNRVACPVKFGEYLACGVRPVLTPHVGDQSDLAVESDLGVVVGAVDVGAAAKRLELDAARPGTLDAAGRRHRREWAAEHISPARAAERLVEFLAETVA